MARENIKTTQAVKAPDYLAWHVTTKGEKSFWNKVGAAWLHKDGKGYTLQLETCPINGRIVLRAPLEDAPPAATKRGGARKRPIASKPAITDCEQLPPSREDDAASS